MTGSSPTAAELGREYLRALAAHDKPGIMALLADDFALEVPCDVAGNNDLADSWHGLEAADSNYDLAFAIIADTTYVDFEVTPGKDDNVAFIETRGDMTMANGRPYKNRYVFRFDAKDGKLFRIREYCNPVTSAIAFGLPLPVSSDDGVGNKFI
jgi:ketosteroid isomerase-like protein